MRRLPLAAAAVGVALIIGYLVVWSGVSSLRQRGSDFSVDYVASQLVREGHAAQLYDQRVEADRHAAILPAGATFDLPYIAPPPAALLTIPFSLANPEVAYRAWSLAQLAMLAAALALVARTAPWGAACRRWDRLSVCVAAAASPATLVLLLMGQWDGLLGLALATAYVALRRGRPAGAGAALGLVFGMTKPHLAVGLALFLLGRREWRAAAGAAAGAAAALAISWGMAGLPGIQGFLGALRVALTNTPPQTTLGLAGLASSWLGSSALTTGVVVVGSLLALGGCTYLGSASRCPANLELCLGGAVALSLLVAPHLLAHDLVLLAPAMVWVTARLTRDSAAAPRLILPAWLGVSLLVAVDAGNGSGAPPGRLVPLALAAAGVAAVVVTRRRGRQDRSPRPAPAVAAAAV